jgi:hypothetical protein
VNLTLLKSIQSELETSLEIFKSTQLKNLQTLTLSGEQEVSNNTVETRDDTKFKINSASTT